MTKTDCRHRYLAVLRFLLRHIDTVIRLVRRRQFTYRTDPVNQWHSQGILCQYHETGTADLRAQSELEKARQQVSHSTINVVKRYISGNNLYSSLRFSLTCSRMQKSNLSP